MFCSGLPLTYNLEVARPMTIADTEELTIAATASQNTANSLFFVAFISCLYLIAGSTLFRNPKTVIALLLRQWPVLLLMLFIGASTLWSYAPEKVFINTIHNAGVMFIAIAAALHYRNSPWDFPRQLGIVVGINMLFHLIAVLLIPAYAIDWQGRWHGLAPHPNTLGALSFVVLWSNTAVIIFKKTKHYGLHFIFVLCAIMAMVGANSMTTMLCSVFTIVTMLMIKNMQNLPPRQRIAFSVIASCFFLTPVIIFGTGLANIDDFLEMLGRDSQLTGRLSLWEIAAQAISEKIFLGWSFDDHVHLVRVSNMSFPNFHNGLLDLAVSGGIVAVLLFLLALALTARDYFKSGKVGSEILPFSLSFLLTYMVYNFTEATLVSPRSQLWIIFLTLVFFGACRKINPQVR
jgi:exopolysaccharide production protein ExoQ